MELSFLVEDGTFLGSIDLDKKRKILNNVRVIIYLHLHILGR